MKAWQIDRLGGELRLKDVPMPEPRPGSVLVRNKATLEALARAGGGRVTPVALTGDVQTDAASLRAASDGGVQLAFDMVGQAGDPNATLAALGSLRRGGRLVLMGSMTTPLPVNYLQLMANNLVQSQEAC